MYPTSSSFSGSENSSRLGEPQYAQLYQQPGLQLASGLASQPTGFPRSSLRHQPADVANMPQSQNLLYPQRNQSFQQPQITGYPVQIQSPQQTSAPARAGQTSAQVAQSFQDTGHAQASLNKPVINGAKIPKIRLSFLTAQDQAKFEQLFKSAVGDGQALSGDKVRDLLVRSKLPGDDLSQIWTLSDTTKSGKLLFPEFALAMYLCNLKIMGKSLPQRLPERITNEVSSMVDIISFGVPDENPAVSIRSNAPAFDMQNSTNSPGLQQPQPQASNSQLLSKLASQPTGFASQYVPPQLTAALGEHLLAQQGSLGSQHQGSFVPSPQIGGYAFQHPSLPPLNSSQRSKFPVAQNPGPALPLNAQSTGKPGQWGFVNAPASGLPNIEALQQRMMPQPGREGTFTTSGLAGNATVPWAITKEEKKLYDHVFRAWDGFGRAYIGGDTAIEVMGQSGLDRPDLEKVWTLSDPSNKGKLDMDEFAVAMHLIYRKLNGYPIPNRLPPELVPPSTRNFKDSIGTVKSLLSQDAEMRKTTGAFLQPQRTGVSYLKTHSFRNEQNGTSESRKDATVFRNNDDDVGYKSSARRRLAGGGRTPSPAQIAASSDAKGVMSLDQLSKIVREKQVLLDAIDFRDENNMEEEDTLDRKDRRDAEDLYRRIRQVQADIDHHPTAVLQSVDSGAERRTLSRQLQSLTDRLPELASHVRKTERSIAETKLELFRLRDAKAFPSSASTIRGTGPGGAVTEADRLKARAKTMMQQRSAALTGKPSPSGEYDQSSASVRLDDENLKIRTEKENNERMIKDIEDSVQAFSRSLEDSLRLRSQSTSTEHEKRRWEDGLGVEDEIKDFIFELQRSSRAAKIRKEGSDDSAGERSLSRPEGSHDVLNRQDDKVQSSIPSAGSIDAGSSKSTYQTAEERAAFIKQQAEQRMLERLAALGLKPPSKAETSVTQKHDSNNLERSQRIKQAEEQEAKRDQERQRRLADEKYSPPAVAKSAAGKKPPPPPSRGARASSLTQQAETKRKAEEEAFALSAEQERKAKAIKEQQEIQEPQTKQLEDETKRQEEALARERKASELRLQELTQQYETGKLKKQEEKQRRQAAENAAKEKERRLASQRAELEAAKERELQLQKQLEDLSNEDSSDEDSLENGTPNAVTPVASQIILKEPVAAGLADAAQAPLTLNDIDTILSPANTSSTLPSYSLETKNPFFKQLSQASESPTPAPSQVPTTNFVSNFTEVSTNPFHRLAQQQEANKGVAPLTSTSTGRKPSRARPEEDDWSVVDSTEDSSDDQDDAAKPTGGSAKQLASMLFGTMGPPRPLSAAEGRKTPVSGKTDADLNSLAVQHNDERTPYSREALTISEVSTPISAPPGPPPPPVPPPGSSSSQWTATDATPSFPPPPPPPPTAPAVTTASIPGAPPPPPPPPAPSASGNGTPPGVGALLGDIQRGKGLRKVETKDRSQATTAGRVID